MFDLSLFYSFSKGNNKPEKERFERFHKFHSRLSNVLFDKVPFHSLDLVFRFFFWWETLIYFLLGMVLILDLILLDYLYRFDVVLIFLDYLATATTIIFYLDTLFLILFLLDFFLLGFFLFF